ncbi:MAG: hypothetical protein E7256_13475 [Lachnospiraceae bacterium]|nr:hypothetical protein [Lachnospiraceae bacterium]
MDKENGCFEQQVFAVKHKDRDVLLKSSSGGAFTALSDAILDQKGVVIGSRYNYESQQMEFSICHTKEERNQLRGSKYIQSNMRGAFSLVDQLKTEGKANLPILFVGTPCQGAALRNYLFYKKIDMPSLYVCDIICHGVASYRFWKEHIELMQRKHKGKVTYVSFKDKRNGWIYPSTIVQINGKEYSISSFAQLFISNNILRPSCYHCQYASMERISDITIGDYWGIEKVHKEFFDPLGVSLMLVNTSKGRDVFDKAKKDFDYIQTSRKECLQPNLIGPTLKPDEREQFWGEYREKGIWSICKKYTDVTVRYKVKRKIKNVVYKFRKEKYEG